VHGSVLTQWPLVPRGAFISAGGAKGVIRRCSVLGASVLQPKLLAPISFRCIGGPQKCLAVTEKWPTVR
jgi:hypothetical protein